MAVDRNKLIQEGDKLVRQGKIDKAIDCFEQALAASPRDINLKNKIGDLYLKVGDNANAVRIYGEIGAFYAEEGFYLKAIAMYKKVNKVDPSAIDVYYKLAELYAKQGLNNDARSQYQQVADLYLKGGNAAKAAEALGQLLKLDPDNVKTRIRLAEIEARQGRLAEAVAEYLAAGDAFQKKGMHEDAVKVAFDPALALDEGHAGLATGLLRSLFEIGKYEDLLARGRALFAKHRENVGFLSIMAETYQRVGQPDMARTAYEKLAGLEPDNPSWKERLSEARTVKKTPQAAATGATGTGAGGGLVPDFTEMSGDYSMAELEEVSGEWTSASDLGPDVPGGGGTAADLAGVSGDGEKDEFILEHQTEAEVFIKYGLVEKAIENLEAIVSRYPDEVETLRRLKDLYLEAGNKAKAAEKCVDLARVARSRGDTQKAIDLLGEARAHDPSVRVDRGSPAASAPAPATEAAGYSFGVAAEPGVEVDLEGGPPSSGIELEFDMPGGGGAQAHRAGSSGADSSDGSAELSYDFGEPEPAPAGGDAIEFSLDEGEGGEEGGVAIELGGEAAGGAEPEEGELAEADFYAEQGFVPEARKRLDALARRFPHSRRVRERLERLASAPAEVASEPAASGEEGIEFFDDAIRAPKREAGGESAPFGGEPAGVEERDESLFEEESAFLSGAEAAPSPAPAAAASGGVGEESLEEIFKEFKEKVEAQVDSEDYKTHYDLGVAYREMGLVDEAIAEFQLASKDPEKFLGCCTNLGICFREKGMPKLAVKWYTKALEKLEDQQDSDEYKSTLYDLGCSHEEAEDKEAALEAFTNLFGLDAGYRDVSDKVDQLSQ